MHDEKKKFFLKKVSHNEREFQGLTRKIVQRELRKEMKEN